METIKLWARNGEAVRQALELGEFVHLGTASEELIDEFLVFAIQSDLELEPLPSLAAPAVADDLDTFFGGANLETRGTRGHASWIIGVYSL